MLINPSAHPTLGLKLPHVSVRGDHAPFAHLPRQGNGQDEISSNVARLASLMESRLQRTLGGTVAASPGSPSSAPLDMSPQAVADRVLGFIDQAQQKYRESGASDVEIRNRLAAAHEGVERGFREAKQLLQNEGGFHGEAAENARQTHDLIQKGIDQLEGRLSGTQASVSEALHVGGYSRFSLKESVALKVQTQEGDVVTIKLRRSAASTEAYRVESDSEGYSGPSFQR